MTDGVHGEDLDPRPSDIGAGGDRMSMSQINEWARRRGLILTPYLAQELSDLLNSVYAKGYSQARKFTWGQVLDQAVDQLNPGGWDYVINDQTERGQHTG